MPALNFTRKNKDPLSLNYCDRAQPSQMARGKGSFARGTTLFRANELARIAIPADMREVFKADRLKYCDAPFLQDGAVVRVTGLWSHLKLPFRVWPASISQSNAADTLEFLILNGRGRGWHFEPEWLVKMPTEEQDIVYHRTVQKMGWDLAAPAAAESTVAALGADLSPAMRKRLAQVRKSAGVAVAPAESALSLALDEFDALVAHVEDGYVGVDAQPTLLLAWNYLKDLEWPLVNGRRVCPLDPQFSVQDDPEQVDKAWVVRDWLSEAVNVKAGADAYRFICRVAWTLKYPQFSQYME